MSSPLPHISGTGAPTVRMQSSVKNVAILFALPRATIGASSGDFVRSCARVVRFFLILSSSLLNLPIRKIKIIAKQSMIINFFRIGPFLRSSCVLLCRGYVLISAHCDYRLQRNIHHHHSLLHPLSIDSQFLYRAQGTSCHL